jgi:hypothetical protein
MRNWEEDFPTISLQLPSRFSAQRFISQKLENTDTPKMALDASNNTQSDPVKNNEKAKGESSSTSTEPTTASAPVPFTDAETKKLLRKLDFHLIPFLALLYL